MNLLPGNEFITEEEAIKSIASLLSVKDEKSLPVQASSILEKYCNRLIELIRNPRKKDEYVLKDETYSKSVKLTIPYPEMAVTDKINTTVIYSDAAIAVDFLTEMTFGINAETYESLKESCLNSNGSIELSINNFTPYVTFVKNKADYKDLFCLVNGIGEKTKGVNKSENEDKTVNAFKRLEGIGEIYLSERKVKFNENQVMNYYTHSLQYTAVVAAMVFKALEDSYFINLSVSVSLSGLRKRGL